MELFQDLIHNVKMKSALYLHISPSLNSKTIYVGYLSTPLPHNADSQHVTTGFHRRPILQTWTGPEKFSVLPKFRAPWPESQDNSSLGQTVLYSNVNLFFFSLFKDSVTIFSSFGFPSGVPISRSLLLQNSPRLLHSPNDILQVNS